MKAQSWNAAECRGWDHRPSVRLQGLLRRRLRSGAHETAGAPALRRRAVGGQSS